VAVAEKEISPGGEDRIEALGKRMAPDVRCPPGGLKPDSTRRRV